MCSGRGSSRGRWLVCLDRSHRGEELHVAAWSQLVVDGCPLSSSESAPAGRLVCRGGVVSLVAAGEPAISTRGLRKVYRTRRGVQVAVEGLDLDVPAGGVHGFLGPNGSGKTTSIRMLLGLVRADAGSMRIFGQQVPQQLPHTAIHSAHVWVDVWMS